MVADASVSVTFLFSAFSPQKDKSCGEHNYRVNANCIQFVQFCILNICALRVNEIRINAADSINDNSEIDSFENTKQT